MAGTIWAAAKLIVKDRGMVPRSPGHEIVGEVVTRTQRPGQGRRQAPSASWIGCIALSAGAARAALSAPLPGRLSARRLRRSCASAAPALPARFRRAQPEPGGAHACSVHPYGALKRVGEVILREQPIMIIGAGGLGLMCLTLHKALNGKAAIVADIDPQKREAAQIQFTVTSHIALGCRSSGQLP